MLDDNYVFDGKHVATEIQTFTENSDPRAPDDGQVPVLVVPALSDDMVEDVRGRIP